MSHLPAAVLGLAVCDTVILSLLAQDAPEIIPSVAPVESHGKRKKGETS